MQPSVELRPNQTIVFIGDSITDAGRNSPAYKPFGFGYVHFVANLLLAKYPHLNLRIVNSGVSGNTVRDLESRWHTDCIELRPDILSILVGINDVWGRHVEPNMLPTATDAHGYELTYKRLLLRAKERCNCGLVLMEPFMFCSDRANRVFQALQEYTAIVRNLASQFDAVVVPLQSLIDAIIERVPPEKWSGDSVHPYVWAHAWIAHRWLEAVNL